MSNNIPNIKIKIFVSLFFIWMFLTNNVFSQYQLQEAFPNLSFSNPLFLTNSGDGSNRIFVVEQVGVIKVFPNNSSVSTAKVFLNITDRVTSGGEMGLLGLAFHPSYESNGYFYVNYTADNPRRTIISRFQVTSNPDSADKISEIEILTFSQPYSNHNGGWIGFGPNDGYLYIGTGDGGSSGDPQNYAQPINTLLGKILRIDIVGGTPYAIPPTNPFVDSTNVQVRKEIFAWGLRNPWRCSFDSNTGWLWAGDVGQGTWEEVDIIENGKNYGWRCYEGNHTYNTAGCNYPEYIFPVWEYSHSVGFSITGGYVYRGPNMPELTGKYIFADYGTRKVWALSYNGITPATNELLLTAPSSVTSFGEDEFKELYITSFSGKIYKFNPVTGCEDINLVTGWNLVSVPFLNSNMSTLNIFPNSTAEVFGYNNGYYSADTLVNGNGYWVKYENPLIRQICGTRISNPVQVFTGWNMIGPFDEEVLTSNIITTPPGIIAGPFYEYNLGYAVSTVLKPGKGYWIKTSGNGILNLTAGSKINKK
jgi:glucose/arabinose dehydrogenase